LHGGAAAAREATRLAGWRGDFLYAMHEVDYFDGYRNFGFKPSPFKV
jgi:hypothetical protein